MTLTISVKKTLSIGLASILTAQVALGSLAESNVWKERRTALAARNAEKAKNPPLLASLPAGLNSSHLNNASSLLNQLPSISGALPTQPKWGAQNREKYGRLSKKLQGLINSIPLVYGQIQDLYDSGDESQPSVLLIQDVHLNSEAQTNIAALLQELINQKQVGLVGVEGAFTPFDFRRLRAFPDKRITKEVTDAFLQKNLLAAPSYVGITSPVEPPPFIGVDDRPHYDANVKAYLDSRLIKDKTSKRIADLKRQLSAAKQNVFSPELKRFDDLCTARNRGDIGLGVYVKRLTQLRISLGRHPRDARHPDDTRHPGESRDPGFKHAVENQVYKLDSGFRRNDESIRRNDGSLDFVIEQFLAAYEMESTLDFTRVDQERKLVIEKLTKVLKEDELSNLLAQSLAYRMGRLSFGDYYQGLKNLCEEKGIHLAATPAFDNYVRYVLLSDGIKADRLFAAVDQMEKEILEKLITRPEERRLIGRSEYLSLVDKLLDFALTPAEWEKYKSLRHTGDMCHPGVSRDPGLKHEIKSQVDNLDSGFRRNDDLTVTNLESFEAFYEQAELRSQKMVGNLFIRHPGTIRHPGESRDPGRKFAVKSQVYKPDSDVRRNDAVVLVTGGFHTPEVAALFRRDKVSYVVVSPKITKIDSGSGTSYLSIFAREKTPLDRLFAGEKLFLAPEVENITSPICGTKLYASMSFAFDRVNPVKFFFGGEEIDVYVKPGASPAENTFRYSRPLMSRLRNLGQGFINQIPSNAVGGLMIWMKNFARRFWPRITDRAYNLGVAPPLENLFSVGIGAAVVGIPVFFFAGLAIAVQAAHLAAWVFFVAGHLADLRTAEGRAALKWNFPIAVLIALINGTIGVIFLGPSIVSIAAIFAIGVLVHAAVNAAAFYVRRAIVRHKALKYLERLEDNKAYLAARSQRDCLIGPGREDFADFGQLHAMVERVFFRLLRAQGLDPEAYRLFLDEAPILAFLADIVSPNASMMSSYNTAIMNLGLLRVLASGGLTEDALAFVLAHEIMHAMQKRSDIDAGKQNQKAKVSDQFLQMRGSEFHADLSALALMDRAGYTVKEAATCFERMLPWLAARHIDDTPWGTHPQIEERIRKIKQVVRDYHWNSYVRSATPVVDPAVLEQIEKRTRHRQFQERAMRVESAQDLVDVLADAQSLTELYFAFLIGFSGLTPREQEAFERIRQAFDRRGEELLAPSPASRAVHDYMTGEMLVMVRHAHEPMMEQLALGIRPLDLEERIRIVESGVPPLFFERVDIDPLDEEARHRQAINTLMFLNSIAINMSDPSRPNNRFNFWSTGFLEVVIDSVFVDMKAGRLSIDQVRRVRDALMRIKTEAALTKATMATGRIDHELVEFFKELLTSDYARQLKPGEAQQIVSYLSLDTLAYDANLRPQDVAGLLLALLDRANPETKLLLLDLLKSNELPTNIREQIFQLDMKRFFENGRSHFSSGSPSDYLNDLLKIEGLAARNPGLFQEFLRRVDRQATDAELVSYHRRILGAFRQAHVVADADIFHSVFFRTRDGRIGFVYDVFEEALLNALPAKWRGFRINSVWPPRRRLESCTP